MHKFSLFLIWAFLLRQENLPHRLAPASFLSLATNIFSFNRVPAPAPRQKFLCLRKWHADPSLIDDAPVFALQFHKHVIVSSDFPISPDAHFLLKFRLLDGMTDHLLPGRIIIDIADRTLSILILHRILCKELPDPLILLPADHILFLHPCKRILTHSYLLTPIFFPFFRSIGRSPGSYLPGLRGNRQCTDSLHNFPQWHLPSYIPPAPFQNIW